MSKLLQNYVEFCLKRIFAVRQMYAILVSVENEGDFTTTFRKNSKKGISCKLLTDFEGNKRKNSKS